MTKEQVIAVLQRIPSWPPERQRELAELALEIEAEISASGYLATTEESRAIDDALPGEVADQADVKSAFASFRQK